MAVPIDGPGQHRRPISGIDATLVWEFQVRRQLWVAWSEDEDGTRFTAELTCRSRAGLEQLLREAEARAWRCSASLSPGA